MDSVLLLWYIRARDTTNEGELLIGVYSSEEEATAAIQRLKDQPGFANAPEGFEIHRYKLNRDSWTEGFVVVD
jgi:hypothetical protein